MRFIVTAVCKCEFTGNQFISREKDSCVFAAQFCKFFTVFHVCLCIDRVDQKTTQSACIPAVSVGAVGIFSGDNGITVMSNGRQFLFGNEILQLFRSWFSPWDPEFAIIDFFQIHFRQQISVVMGEQADIGIFQLFHDKIMGIRSSSTEYAPEFLLMEHEIPSHHIPFKRLIFIGTRRINGIFHRFDVIRTDLFV